MSAAGRGSGGPRADGVPRTGRHRSRRGPWGRAWDSPAEAQEGRSFRVRHNTRWGPWPAPGGRLVRICFHASRDRTAAAAEGRRVGQGAHGAAPLDRGPGADRAFSAVAGQRVDQLEHALGLLRIRDQAAQRRARLPPLDALRRRRRRDLGKREARSGQGDLQARATSPSVYYAAPGGFGLPAPRLEDLMPVPPAIDAAPFEGLCAAPAQRPEGVSVRGPVRARPQGLA